MDKIYHLCSVPIFFILCLKLSSAVTMESKIDVLSHRLDNLAFEIHVFRRNSQKRMDDMDTTIKDNIPLPKPVSSEIFDKGQIQRQIRQVLERHANVVHKMLSSEKKARHDMREQLNKSFADLRTDFDGFEDAFNTKVGDLNMKLDSVKKYTIKGEKGEPGQSGSEIAGITGPRGFRGFPGRKGSAGTPGVKGEPGLEGTTGFTGPRGFRGFPGRKGSAGPPGVKGEPGLKGPTGNTGPKGDKGQRGFDGLPGLEGLPGMKGLRGPVGPKGDKGD